MKHTTFQPLFVVFFLILTALILWPGLSGPYIYDDHKNLAPLLEEEASYKTAIFENKAGPFGRGFTMATFAFNHWLKGELIPYDLKLTNLLLHLFNGCLLYWLLYFLLKIKFNNKKSNTYALLITVFWLLNPVNTGVVFYVIQRATLLSMAFMLVSCLVYVYLRSRERQFNLYTLFLLFICIISWILGILSKENAILLPFIILCIELCFFDKFEIDKLNKNNMITISFIIISTLFITIAALYNSGYLDYSERKFTLAERLYTQPVVISLYLQEILLPQSVDVSLYRNDDLQIRKTIWNFASISSLLLIIILITFSCLSLKSNKYKYIGAGILIYFTGHLIESTIFPLELFFRHRNYFPSFGLYLTLILLIDRVLTTERIRKIFLFVSILYCLLLTSFSFVQAKVWSSYDLILLNAIEKHPDAMGGYLTIIGELLNRKDLSSSLSISSSIILARPEYSLPIKIQRFYAYCKLATDIPENEYQILERDLNLYNPELISLSFTNLLDSYSNNQCDFIDIERIVGNFTGWADQQLLSGNYTTEELWYTEYYMVEFLLLLGKRNKAIERLNLHIKHGNSKALYFKESMF